MLSRRWSVLATIIAGAILTACHDELLVAPNGESTSARAIYLGSTSPASFDGGIETYDDEMLRLAATIPGFGGVFYEPDGTPVIYLQDLGRRFDAEHPIAEFLDRHAFKHGVPRKPTRFVRGQFSFDSLKAWQRVATENFLATPGVVLTDVDERNNRVVIGVESVALRKQIATAMQARRVPPAALAVMLHEPIRQSNTTLSSVFTTLPGGIRINDGIADCTLGVNVYKSKYSPNGWSGVYDNTRYFVTNAHCTNRMGQVESTWFYQPDRFKRTYAIGVEVREAHYGDRNEYLDCPIGHRCALADAALVQYQAVEWELGSIARPQYAGAILINPSNPRLAIRDSTEASGVWGTAMDFVGSYGGWRYGSVNYTCFNYYIAAVNITLLCQDAINIGNEAGDSGAPVFRYNIDHSVTIAGLVWGHGASITAYSPWVYVKAKLTQIDRPTVCGFEWPCWLGLQVSSPFVWFGDKQPPPDTLPEPY
jgi:hypothetical protein